MRINSGILNEIRTSSNCTKSNYCDLVNILNIFNSTILFVYYKNYSKSTKFYNHQILIAYA